MHGVSVAPRGGVRGVAAFDVSSEALRRLADAASKPLAVVVAPAGYGKTAMLRAFTAQRGAVYVDLAATERTFRDAVRTLCEALRSAAPGARLAFASAYARAAQGPDRSLALARWLARNLDGARITLVIDSIDRLGGESSAFGRFAELLVADARGSRAVLGAREDADLPIPRWFAEDLIATVIGAPDLRWTMADAAAAAHRLGLDYDARALGAVVRESEGRPFDIVYALHAGTGPVRFLDPGAAILDGLLPGERRYVLDTCLLHEIDDRVLAAGGWVHHPLLDGGSALSALAVQRYDCGVYRYDDTLRRHAVAVLRADPARYAHVAAATIAALRAVGRVRDALLLACGSGCSEAVHALLREHGLDLQDRGDTDAVDAALEQLPAECEEAEVLLLRATREVRLGRLDTSEAWFRHAAAAAPSRRVAAQAAYRLGRELVRRERADAVELLEPYASDPTLDVTLRCAIRSVLAEAYVLANRISDCRCALAAALADAAHLDVAARAHLYTRAAYVELYAGDRAQAREYAVAGASLAEAVHLYVVAVGSFSVLYNLAYEEGGPTESLVYLERLSECAIRSGNVDFHLYAIVAAYEQYVELGDLRAVERLEHDLREFDVHYGAASALQGMLPSRALVAAWQGAFASAYDLLAPSALQQNDPDRAALRWAEIALYAAAAGMNVAAREALGAYASAYGALERTTPHAERGAIVARLAASLAGVPAPPGGTPRAGRLSALARAVDTVIAYRGGALCAEQLLDALDDLRRHELAGIAKLLAALPPVRR